MKVLFCTLILLLHYFCPYAQNIHKETRLHVGDIPFDPATDNPDFAICDESNVLPYNTRYGMFFDGERYGVLKYFEENYTLLPVKGQTGYITIRFLVNCKGETDRFRVYEMDKEMNETEFDEEIVQNLLRLTKALNGWKTHVPEPRDYYQYLLFKLKDGRIETILP